MEPSAQPAFDLTEMFIYVAPVECHVLLRQPEGYVDLKICGHRQAVRLCLAWSRHLGRTQVSESGTSVRVAVTADSQRFEQLFLDTLNAP